MSPDRRPLAARAIVRIARCVPGWRRAAWRDEWLGEIGAAPSASWRHLISWTLGASVHAAWLWGREWSLDMIASDVRFAVRTLLRQRAFAAAATLTLALGIGTTTAMFTVVHAVLLKPLPYRDARQLVTIWPGTSFSPHDLATALDRPDTFQAIGAYSAWGMTISGSQQAESLRGARVSPSLFSTLGVRPIAGRLIEAGEDRAGRDAVALVSEAYAGRRFGSAAAALGQRLIVNGVTTDIVGVMPASFAFPDARSDVWTPITIDASRPDYDAGFASLIGRLRAGVTAAQAQDRMRLVAAELRRQHLKDYSEKFVQRATVVPLQRRLVGDLRTPLLLLFGSVTILLVIACANVAILMMTRAASRQGEIAVRAALGAERIRIVRQLLIESLVVSAIGGAAGVLLAVWLVGLATPFIPPNLPHTAHPSIDAIVLGFAGLVVTGSAIFFGLVPALQLSRADVRQVLAASRGAEAAQAGRKFRQALVFIEVALATVLVVSAALLGRSFLEAASVPLGFDPSRVLTVRASVPTERYKDPIQVSAVFDDVLARVAAVPGVTGAGAIQLLPLTPDNWNPGVLVDGVPDADQYPGDVNWRVVTPGYFDAMDIPVRRGRGIVASDRPSSTHVAVVNETFARLVFHGREPIGRRLRTGFEAKGDWVEVVGVVGDLHQHTPEQPAEPELYRPFAQHPIESMRVMARASGEPGALAPAVRDAIASVDPNIALADVEPMSAVVERTLGSRRAPLAVASCFALLALVLGLVGITGVLSFDVAQRRREIGIRLALGATAGQIKRTVLGRGLALAVAGIAAGVGAAALSSRVLESMLFGVSATDPATIAVVVLAFLVVTLIVIVAPANHAARVDPLRALRDE